MKKILIIVLILIFLGLTVLISIQGIKIGPFKIESIKDIQASSKNIKESLSKTIELTSIKYPEELEKLQKSIDNLGKAEETYNSKVAYTNENTTIGLAQVETYEIEFLWTIIGNYATEEGTTLTLDITEGTNKDTYNLSFTLTGSYIGITDFIYDLENDEDLNFKIENLKMETVTVNAATSEATTSTTKTNTIANTTTNTTTNTTKAATSSSTANTKTKSALQAKFNVDNISINLE